MYPLTSNKTEVIITVYDSIHLLRIYACVKVYESVFTMCIALQWYYEAVEQTLKRLLRLVRQPFTKKKKKPPQYTPTQTLPFKGQ